MARPQVERVPLWDRRAESAELREDGGEGLTGEASLGKVLSKPVTPCSSRSMVKGTHTRARSPLPGPLPTRASCLRAGQACQ